MKVERMKWITRAIVRANPDKAFLFGDNVQRVGFGGQAKEMRGEPNAFGIATKYKALMGGDAFLTDDDYLANCERIDSDFRRLKRSGPQTVVIPADGLGTGLAELDKRAPKTFAYLQEKLKEIETW